jgi:chemotaxis family two-component system response regulator Rcp1
MDEKPTISLQCVRKNGRREVTKLLTHTLSEARELANWVLHVGNGLYTEVDICTEAGTIETIQNPAVPIQNPAVPMSPSEVLLVEDNAGDALLIGQALEECPMPVHLRIARDGEQALQILEEPDFTPDLIILDLNIPRISGYAVLASHPLRKTPVVVFSASENEADVGRVLSLGAKDFVHKPLDLDDYKVAVTGMVQKWAGHDSAGMESRPS